MGAPKKRKGRSYHARRRRRVKFIINIIEIAVAIIAVYYILAFTPILNLGNISVEGTNIVQSDEVIDKAQIPDKINILRINRRRVAENIEKIPYVSSAKIKYVFPNNIKIVITEGSVYYSFKTEKGFLNTDENFKNLEVTSTPKIFPVFENLKLTENGPGEKITIDESEKYDIILIYYNVLKNRTMLESVETISIDDYNVGLKLKSGVKVICGSSSDAERKIAALSASIAANIDENGEEPKTGTFDITDPRQVVYSIK